MFVQLGGSPLGGNRKCLFFSGAKNLSFSPKFTKTHPRKHFAQSLRMFRLCVLFYAFLALALAVLGESGVNGGRCCEHATEVGN